MSDLSSQINARRSTQQVIVIDDVCRFALYTWRYLSDSIGFGIGDVPADGGGRFLEDGRLVPITTPAGDISIWWINISPSWEKDLAAVLDQIKQQPCHFLIDLFADDTEAYHVDKVVAFLLKRRVLKVSKGELSNVWLISSYETTPRLFTSTHGTNLRLPILAKDAETFQRLRQELGKDLKQADEGRTWKSLDSRHLLVTGAGFERVDQADSKINPFGIPSTQKLLRQTLETCQLEPVEGDGFPLPLKYRDLKQAKALEQAARERDLDTYWNELLILEQREYPDMLEASEREHHLRNAFRRIFLDYDYGFLEQCLEAVRLQWDGWLTTNYTRFINRAVDFEQGESGREASDSEKLWRGISTESEAARLLRELLHGVHWKKGRLFFKLHGDLGHLTTMAIAGYDKEFYSPLTLPIDELHLVYSAAEQFLGKIFKVQQAGIDKEIPPSGAATIFWHVVGHSLQDRLLLSTIRRVCGDQHHRHIFLLVGPDPVVLEAINDRLTKAVPKLARDQVLKIQLTARQYMARIAKCDLFSEDFSNALTWLRRTAAASSS